MKQSSAYFGLIVPYLRSKVLLYIFASCRSKKVLCLPTQYQVRKQDVSHKVQVIMKYL